MRGAVLGRASSSPSASPRSPLHAAAARTARLRSLSRTVSVFAAAAAAAAVTGSAAPARRRASLRRHFQSLPAMAGERDSRRGRVAAGEEGQAAESPHPSAPISAHQGSPAGGRETSPLPVFQRRASLPSSEHHPGLKEPRNIETLPRHFLDQGALLAPPPSLIFHSSLDVRHSLNMALS